MTLTFALLANPGTKTPHTRLVARLPISRVSMFSRTTTVFATASAFALRTNSIFSSCFVIHHSTPPKLISMMKDFFTFYLIILSDGVISCRCGKFFAIFQFLPQFLSADIEVLKFRHERRNLSPSA